MSFIERRRGDIYPDMEGPKNNKVRRLRRMLLNLSPPKAGNPRQQGSMPAGC
ncbi:protein of unknown function (plasmid) [Cupriavidus taiwanensis]|uniref:Uncharacterized protein n=1 Tax=Cupriavidus taiwanensis TaxID=164546 RepID=A0A375IUT3_9BURK|nr:protein of unknown function [Cupriavidus taiwanensis]